MTSRKGLKRYGMRAYLVQGARGSIVIRRMGQKFFHLRYLQFDNLPWGLWGMRFPTLGEAADFARKDLS